MTTHNSDTASAVRGRITARVSADKQRVLQLAADLTGSTLNQFIVQAAIKAAEEVFAQEEVFRETCLTAEESERFLAALDSPPEPNAALLSAMDAYWTINEIETEHSASQ